MADTVEMGDWVALLQVVTVLERHSVGDTVGERLRLPVPQEVGVEDPEGVRVTVTVSVGDAEPLVVELGDTLTVKLWVAHEEGEGVCVEENVREVVPE